MDKGKNISNGHTVIEAIGVSMVSLLQEEGRVVIPELGYLELKVFPDKQTVLFKATDDSALFLTSEGSIQSQIYNSVSIPLKEGKIITLPEVGIFRPMKNPDGSSRISFTISSALRKLLNNGKENEIGARKVELTGNQEKADSGDVAVPEVVKSADEQIVEKKVTISVPKREIRADRKIPSYIRNTSKVGDLIVPQERRMRRVTKKMRGIIATVLAFVALILILGYFLSTDKNKYEDYVSVSGNNNSELTQTIDEDTESIDLPSLAERKYGNRIFWVYIYEANRDKISSPVNIPAGTILRIPNLWEDYNVDVMDSMEIRRAGILSDIMLKRKK